MRRINSARRQTSKILRRIDAALEKAIKRDQQEPDINTVFKQNEVLYQVLKSLKNGEIPPDPQRLDLIIPSTAQQQIRMAEFLWEFIVENIQPELERNKKETSFDKNSWSVEEYRKYLELKSNPQPKEKRISVEKGIWILVITQQFMDPYQDLRIDAITVISKVTDKTMREIDDMVKHAATHANIDF